MVYAKHGTFVRVIYLVVACVFWLVTGRGRFGPGRVVVLCFHGVSASQRDRFGRMVRHVSQRAISTSALDDDHRRGGLRVCLTFDDAFSNLLANALPILNENGVPATVFAVSDNLGSMPKWPMPADHHESSEPTMTREQLRSALSDTVRIGSHTQTHPSLTSIDSDARRAELAGSKASLESVLDAGVDELAFPHGSYDSATVKAALAAGYHALFSLDPVVHPGRLQEGVIGRFSADPDMWFVEFALTCDGAYAWLHPFRRALRILRKDPAAQDSRLSSESF